MIDKQALLNALRDRFDDTEYQTYKLFLVIYNIIKDFPESNNGKWEKWNGKNYSNFLICSNCKFCFPLIAEDYNFCPICGSYMKGDENEDNI